MIARTKEQTIMAIEMLFVAIDPPPADLMATAQAVFAALGIAGMSRQDSENVAGGIYLRGEASEYTVQVEEVDEPGFDDFSASVVIETKRRVSPVTLAGILESVIRPLLANHMRVSRLLLDDESNDEEHSVRQAYALNGDAPDSPIVVRREVIRVGE
jgi:hypothetical protein